jgi:hypothetical protein
LNAIENIIVVDYTPDEYWFLWDRKLKIDNNIFLEIKHIDIVYWKYNGIM